MKHLKRAVIFIVFAIALSFAGRFCYELVQNSGLQALREDAKAKLALISAAFLAPSDKYSYLPDIAAQHASLEQALTVPGGAQAANEYLSELNAAAGSGSIYLLTIQGVAIASSNWNQPGSVINRNYSQFPYFTEAKAGQRSRVYGVGESALAPALFFSRPVVRANRVIGVLVVQIDLSALDQNWDASRDQVAMMDENGVILLSTQKDWKFRPIQPLTPAALNRIVQTHRYENSLKEPLQAVIERALTDREMILTAATPPSGRGPSAQSSAANLPSSPTTRYLALVGDLPGSGWGIAILTPTADVDQAALRFSLGMMGGLCFLALIALYVKEILWATRQKEASRQALVNAHKELASKHTQLANLSRKLLRTAITDPLTGAYNRGHFLQITGKLINYIQRYDSHLCVLMIDIDFFKRVNDTYGHPAGDEVLKHTTQTLKKMMRKHDSFARFGGEEFVVALADTSPEDALVISNRIREELASHKILIGLGDTTISITMSGGLSEVLPGESTIEAALKRADEALYVAKKGGRNQICVKYELSDPHAGEPPPLER